MRFRGTRLLHEEITKKALDGRRQGLLRVREIAEHAEMLTGVKEIVKKDEKRLNFDILLGRSDITRPGWLRSGAGHASTSERTMLTYL